METRKFMASLALKYGVPQNSLDYAKVPLLVARLTNFLLYRVVTATGNGAVEAGDELVTVTTLNG